MQNPNNGFRDFFNSECVAHLKQSQISSRIYPKGKKQPVRAEDIRWVAPAAQPADTFLEDTLAPLAWSTRGRALLDASGSGWHAALPFARKLVHDAEEIGSLETEERFDLILTTLDLAPSTRVLTKVRQLLHVDGLAVVIVPCATAMDQVDASTATAGLHAVDDIRFSGPEVRDNASLVDDAAFASSGFRLARHSGAACRRALVLRAGALALAGSPAPSTLLSEALAEEQPARAPVEPVARSSPEVDLAIFTLVRGGAHNSDYAAYEQRCISLRAATNASMPSVRYDDLAFHEGNVPGKVVLRELESALGVRFIDARRYGGFGLPPSVRRRGSLNVSVGGYRAGYSHMCRWFAMQWIVALRSYKYAMRIDEVSPAERAL